MLLHDLRDRQVVLSGCSGGGKSTLLDELAARGFATVPEPGRRVIAQAADGTGGALPWVDLAAFARCALATARNDRAVIEQGRWTFFDRGLIDAAVALAFATGQPLAPLLDGEPRFHRHVFMTPPWAEMFVRDDARRHDLADAIAEYDRLRVAYATLGYRVIVLPKVSVRERADFVLDLLASAAPGPG